MSENVHREEEVFSAAFAIEDAAEREAFVQRATVGDPELRARVARLLEAVEETGQFFDPSDRAAVNLTIEAGEQVGDRIGPYKLMERLGEGGFGTVYVAEQEPRSQALQYSGHSPRRGSTTRDHRLRGGQSH